MLDNPDDLRVQVAGAAGRDELQALPDGWLAGPDLGGQRLIDDDARARIGVVGIEDAAG